MHVQGEEGGSRMCRGGAIYARAGGGGRLTHVGSGRWGAERAMSQVADKLWEGGMGEGG